MTYRVLIHIFEVGIREGYGILKNRESQKILKFGNPESQKSNSRNFQEYWIPKILIPKLKIPGQFFGLILKIPKTFFKLLWDTYALLAYVVSYYSVTFSFCICNAIWIQEYKKLFQDLSGIPNYRKSYSRTFQEYWIPKIFNSWTSGFPKKKKSGMAPP